MLKINGKKKTERIRCNFCGELFIPSRKWSVFCSSKCRWLNWDKKHPRIKAIVLIVLMMGLCSVSYAEISTDNLADAIKRAENSKTKPYGIMKAYCTDKTEAKCRKGCIQTIEHALRDYKGPEEGFIAFLGSRYAPIGAKNDPKGLNANWVRNVKFFYSKGLTS